MKLKDVMLCNYDEVKEALLSGEKNLEACYKMLAIRCDDLNKVSQGSQEHLYRRHEPVTCGELRVPQGLLGLQNHNTDT